MSKVSFVVITSNDEHGISRRLWELRHQRLDRGVARAIEIVVVDCHSTDRTLLLAVPFADALAVAGPDRAAQEDLGRRIATGDVCVFIDAQTEITPWLADEAATRELAGQQAGQRRDQETDQLTGQQAGETGHRPIDDDRQLALA